MFLSRGGWCVLAMAGAATMGACTSGGSSAEHAGGPPSVDAGTSSDPFAAQPDEAEGLTNVSADLDALLEHGALQGACDRYRGGQTDRKTMLLCGKWMYLYESFGTAGVPSSLVDFFAQNFPDELGIGFEKLGLVLDPTSSRKLPLGLAPTAPLNGTIDAVAFTCASCHLGRLPDGRYAVGAANHAYDYGRHLLTLMLAAGLGTGLSAPSDHDPDAVAKVQPVVDRITRDSTLQAELARALFSLTSMKQPAISKDVEHAYATWDPGTLDFLIAPLPVDDGVEVVGKMVQLWGLPRPAEIASSGMSNAMLGWSGDTPSLSVFLHGFAKVGGSGQDPSDAFLAPLAEYIYSLRAPSAASPPDAALTSRGAALFVSAGCAGCHDGPRGAGKRVYTFDEIGTDRGLAKWLDPTLSGNACCGVSLSSDGRLTHGVKAPRLVGLWTLGRFLHNGSLTSLEQLLCAEPRPPSRGEPFGDDGHTFGCALAVEDKHALLAFLRSH